MERRRFLKGTALALTTLSLSKVALASEYEEEYRHGEGRHGRKGQYRKYNRLRDRRSPSVLEQKHVPTIDLPSEVRKGEFFDVKVRVGFMKEHPSTPDHWITEIKLLVDGQKMAKEEHYLGGVSPSEATFRIKLDRSASLEAIEHCNLHGTWISEPVRVNVS